MLYVPMTRAEVEVFLAACRVPYTSLRSHHDHTWTLTQALSNGFSGSAWEVRASTLNGNLQARLLSPPPDAEHRMVIVASRVFIPPTAPEHPRVSITFAAAV